MNSRMFFTESELFLVYNVIYIRIPLVCSDKLSNAIIKRLKDSCAEKYFLKLKIKIDQENIQAIIFPFNRSPQRIPSRPLTVNDTTIEIRDSVKYLRVHLGKKLTFKKQVHHLVEKAIKCDRALCSLLNRKSIFNRQNCYFIKYVYG